MNMWTAASTVHSIRREDESDIQYNVRCINESMDRRDAEIAEAQQTCLSILGTCLKGMPINRFLVRMAREAIWEYFYNSQYPGAVVELFAKEFDEEAILFPCRAGEQFSISIQGGLHTVTFLTKSLHQERLNAANHFRNW